KKIAQSVEYSDPRITFISNLGRALDVAPSADYWTQQIRGTVQFSNGMRELADHRVFLEIGPQPILSRLGPQTIECAHALWLASLQPDSNWDLVLTSMGKLYLFGIEPNFDRFHGGWHARRLVGLPTFPFQHKKFPLPSTPSISFSNVTAPEEIVHWTFVED